MLDNFIILSIQLGILAVMFGFVPMLWSFLYMTLATAAYYAVKACVQYVLPS